MLPFIKKVKSVLYSCKMYSVSLHLLAQNRSNFFHGYSEPDTEARIWAVSAGVLGCDSA
jgi:hypothetical protein